MTCDHSLRLGTLCALCGIEIIEDDKNLFCLLHSTDSLRSTQPEAYKIGKKRKKELDKEKKLILIVDLDQTIIHATYNKKLEDLFKSNVLFEHKIEKQEKINQEINLSDASDENKKRHKYEYKINLTEDLIKNTLFSFNLDNIKFYVKIRPYIFELLEYCYLNFEMHVYTMGNRKYADTILNLIDPDKKYFDNRIISRDENNNALQKSLDRISTEHRNIVILDDRGDVWKFCKNLINIKPYYFFVEGDINNPFKSKKQILNTNETVECIYDNFNDNELLFVKNILERVYSEYFTKQKNTRKILSKLRNIIFKDLNFYVDKQNKSFIDRKYIKKIIKNCGGTLNKHYKFDYIIATNDLNIDNNYFKVSKFKCNIISYKYIIECFYSFKRLDPKEFIIFDYENKLIEDLEDEFNL